MNATDLLHDSDGDLLIQNGDLKIGASDPMHVADLIGSYPGDWKQFPLRGVGVNNFSGSTGEEQAIDNQIRQQVIADNYQVKSLAAKFDSSNNLTIDIDVIRIR